MDMTRYWECGPKRGHPTRQAALRMAADIRRATRGGSTLAPYQCRLCRQWHLAHRTRTYFLAWHWAAGRAQRV